MRSLRDKHEFRPIAIEISERPIASSNRITFWLVIALILVTAGWLIIGKVDIVVAAHGKIVPTGQIMVIQPLDTGVIRYIYVKAGDRVHKGDPLVEIEPELTAPQLQSSTRELSVLRLEQERILALLDGRSYSPKISDVDAAQHAAIERSIYSAEVQGLAQSTQTREFEKAQTSKEIAAAYTAKAEAAQMLSIAQQRMEKLARVADIVAGREIDTTQEDIVKYTAEIAKASSQIDGLTKHLAQIGSQQGELRSEQRSRLLKQLDESKQRAIELDARVRESAFKHAREKIVAPADGTINERMINTVGGVVTPAEKLMTLVPDADPLEVEALVENREVGYLRPGMPVAIKVDTFEYQKYGTIEGTVRQVASDSIKDEKLGEVFKAFITPKKRDLLVDGKLTAITSGMTVITEVKVGKRRIIEFFIYPIIKSLDKSFGLK